MKSPVLFMIFKREDTTRRVFERIREAKPPRLYIAADGPRKEILDEVEKCKKTRNVVENVDWPCEVFHLYRDTNLGCGKGVSSAITWFFKQEEQGIIIEDDILPHIDFFKFCDEMLDKYRNDIRIHAVCGHNVLYQGYNSDMPYYLSNYSGIWGWASWRRVWETYEFDLKKISKEALYEKLYKRLPKRTCDYYMYIYKYMTKKTIDTWDYQFYFNQILNDRYTIIPYTNMTRNIGFNTTDAAHTTSANYYEMAHVEKTIYPFNHPDEVKEDKNADLIRIKNSGFYKKNLCNRLLSKVFNYFR